MLIQSSNLIHFMPLYMLIHSDLIAGSGHGSYIMLVDLELVTFIY